MATTPNFNWATPDNTGLVKNGALDIRTLGNAIDSSLVDLKGGTTGQVLTKASNTDMDFSWVADATGIPATIFDAKGDIIAATAADTASRLAVGTNNQVLTADSSTATGLKWATPASGAKIVQVVTATTTTETGNSTNTYADTTLTASITPTSASNTILVIASHNGVGRTANSSASNVNIKLFRGATEIGKSLYIGETNTAVRQYIGTTVITKMDSPATTSSTTYKTQFMNDGNTTAAYVQLGSSTSTIVLMEVAP
jgi:hypothetical protein